MAKFAAKCEFFAAKYGMWFSDQHKQDACVTFDTFSFIRTDLCYSELFWKAISRAMKSASKVKTRDVAKVFNRRKSSNDRRVFGPKAHSSVPLARYT